MKFIITIGVSIWLLLITGCVSNYQSNHQSIYDDDFVVNSIKRTWGKLSSESDFSHHGKVILQFHLMSDGSASDIKVVENTVENEQVEKCKKAVLDSAPFQPWSEDMVRMVGMNYRVCTVAFNY